ncbi:hypothetical protein SAMN05216350_102596 [Polaromonas sp. YR568]|nr:hypothetical protein SAMN05216350_102596 [Polaromonas sp. YR568]
MATLNVIRRWALRDQMSIREISRRTGLARNTVKKHLRSEESEPKYPRRVSSSKLDPYAEKLATWLGIEATKSRKQRRTLRQIHTTHPQVSYPRDRKRQLSVQKQLCKDPAKKGEHQELIHIVSTFCSQRVWVKIRWKTRVRLQRNSTDGHYVGTIVGDRLVYRAIDRAVLGAPFAVAHRAGSAKATRAAATISGDEPNIPD